MVQQYRAIWNVPGGGLGYSVFHAQASSVTTAQALADNVRAFIAGCASAIPNDVTVNFDTEVLTLNTATGVLEGSIPVTAPLAVAGSISTGWAAGSGVRIDWLTGTIVGGRRLRGRTFIVPASGFDPDGTPSAALIADIQSAADALLAAGQSTTAEIQVWSRKNGIVADVTSATVPNKSALLRSRRD